MNMLNDTSEMQSAKPREMGQMTLLQKTSWKEKVRVMKLTYLKRLKRHK